MASLLTLAWLVAWSEWHSSCGSLATSCGDLASFHLERCLDAYPAHFADSWTPAEYWDAADIALEMPEHPIVWPDGLQRGILFYWRL